MTYSHSLVELLTLNPPVPTSRSIGFLEITGLSRKESVNTRVYAYFLDKRAHPPLADLFMSALVVLLRRKFQRDLVLSEFYCELEVVTANKNRIDLLITDHESGCAIIIENKLYHHLSNNLRDYFNHSKCANKVGILLTLDEQDIAPEYSDIFVNITHKEWIDAVRSAGLPAGLSMNTYLYLNDFIQTVTQLTRDNTMNEQVDFFFRYTPQVMNAKACYEEAHRFISSEFEVVAAHFKWDIGVSGPTRRYIWNPKIHKEVYYVFEFENLFTEQRQFVTAIELYQGTIAKRTHLDATLANDPHFLALDRTGYQSNTYWHYASKTYRWDPATHPRFSAFLIEVLERDFHELILRIIDSVK